MGPSVKFVSPNKGLTSKKKRSRLNALSVTFDFFGESDWGSDWTKMDNVTLYYSIIILCNLGAKPNFLIWDDKE